MELAGGITAFLARDGAAWRISAGRREGGPSGGPSWSVAYSDFSVGFPGTVAIRQEPAGGASGATALTFQVSQLETNVPIDPRAFDVAVPADAQALSLDELRQSGPLADKGGRP
jgi:hypothetical protein